MHKTAITETTVIEITDEEGERALGKKRGRYITVEMPPFSSADDFFDERLDELIRCIRLLLPPGSGTVLAAGVGNADITSDSLGPMFAKRIIATRHLSGELCREIGFDEPLRSVAAVSTAVLGQTGIESSEFISHIVSGIAPQCVITVDALAARKISRLGCTVQLSDTGIAPGSGIGNMRKQIDIGTVGVPVIAVGVPTVIGALTLAGSLFGERDEKRLARLRGEPGADMTVAPKDIDLVVKNASYLLALAVNCALQPSLSPRDAAALM